MKKVYLIISILLWMVSSSPAKKSIRIDYSQIDGIVKELKDSLNIPGIAVGIAVGNEIKYTTAFGYANIETKTALNTNSVWQICSISKQFSTVACLKLAEENKLSLQDKISKYIDDLPKEYLEITIFNLLSQTSGIKDYLNEKKLYGVSWETVKNQVLSDTLNFEPGNAWSYSNTGFWIAARIIEKVTGMDYNQYLALNFFDALNMAQTQRISNEKGIESRVSGYEYQKDKFVNSVEDISKFNGQGDGDLMSTLNDLLKWNMALTSGDVIAKESILKLWTPTKLRHGGILEIAPNSGINYGMGWFIKNINNDKIVWTPGSGFGFSTSSLYVPEYNFSIIVFCNKDQFLMADEVGFTLIRNILY